MVMPAPTVQSEPASEPVVDPVSKPDTETPAVDVKPPEKVSACRAEALLERRDEILQLAKLGKKRVVVQSGCMLSNGGEAVVRSKDRITVIASNESDDKLLVVGKATIPGLGFLAILDTGGERPELYSVAQLAKSKFRTLAKGIKTDSFEFLLDTDLGQQELYDPKGKAFMADIYVQSHLHVVVAGDQEAAGEQEVTGTTTLTANVAGEEQEQGGSDLACEGAPQSKGEGAAQRPGQEEAGDGGTGVV